MFHSLQQQQQQQQLLNNNINNNDNNNATGGNSTQSMKDDLINFLKDIGSSSTGNTFSNTNMNENSNNLEYLPMNTNTISSYSFNNN